MYERVFRTASKAFFRTVVFLLAERSYVPDMPLLTIHDITIVLVSYLIGGFTAGYYLVKAREKVDLREKGDGTLGARNVYKIMGPMGFIVVAMLDMAKGSLVAWFALKLSPDTLAVYAASVAVVAGHIFPAHLGFRGGKGVMTATGVMLVLDPLLMAGLVGLVLPVLLVLRKLDLSGLIIVAFSPVVAFAVGREGPILVLLTVFAILILWAHRSILREELVHPTVE